MTRALYILLATLILATVTAAASRVSIRQVDFDNFTYAWNGAPLDVPMSWTWLIPTPEAHVRTVAGIHHFYLLGQSSYERQHSPLISVDSVSFGDLNGDGLEEAVVALNYSTGGTANWDYLYIYQLKSGQPKLLARMQTGSRADGGLIRAFVRENLLIVDFADSERHVGDCCSEGYVRVKYRWREGAFVEEGQREHGELYLQEGPPRPGFRDYRVETIYNGESAVPLITKEFRAFRTRIRQGAQSDVEFAGHYTVPRWGCGTECNGFVVVDSITGNIYVGFGVAGLPFDWLEKHGGADAIPRMEFHPHSRLLKVNGCPNEEDCGFYDYEMIEGKGLKLLDFIPLAQ